MPVRDFVWPEETLLVSIRRNEQDILPHGDTILRMDDTLLILTDTDHATDVRRQLRKKTLIK
ncbi:chloride channel protein [Tetragenococcus muriaticus PMC-11-5]|nr:chloride channel protein [Tetragenococcus muriaticus PMC-11-5]